MSNTEPTTPPKRPGSVSQTLFGGMEGVTPLQRIILFAAVIFSIVAAAAFIYGIISLISRVKLDEVDGQVDILKHVIRPNFNTFAIVAIGIICALFSLRLFGKAGSLTSQVIRNEDRELLVPLIKAPNIEAISQYIRLASLSGFAGTFTYLGFTGLPLATVILTLILLGTAIGVNDDDMQKSIFDMAKLTLGAFLGSFVQRNIEQEKLVAGTGIGAGPPPPVTTGTGTGTGTTGPGASNH
jgi:hypothetical protein